MGQFPSKEVDQFQAQIQQIQAQLDVSEVSHDGKSAEQAYADKLSQMSLTEGADGEIQDGRTVVKALCIRCALWSEVIKEKYASHASSISFLAYMLMVNCRQGKIDERFQDTYDKLVKIRNQLEQMNLTHAWSLRETDLYSYQRQLDRIDEARVSGNFIDAAGRPADLHAQRTLLYLLRKSYSFIYQYIVSSEPVSEALLPIYNQLLTLKRCLEEVKRSGGVDSPRELYPYSMKLNSIDNMKKDGKFMVGNDIPEGQASVTALLSECFEMAYELRNEADERKEKTGGEPDPSTINGVGVGYGS